MTSRTCTLWKLAWLALVACIAALPSAATAAPPNILWLSAEDISPHLGCYGDPYAQTPHLDALARDGVRYTHAFTTAGVCAPCRSGIITGMYQTTLGTQHMRGQATLPPEIEPFPKRLRAAGYYCTNNSKQDYQFRTPAGTWDESSGKAHWRKRPRKDQPFFAVFNFTGCHESGIASTSKYRQVTRNLAEEQRHQPEDLALPPYYPDTPVVREDWKRNYELITAMDQWAGDLIQQLKDDGLYEQTIIFFWSDHGVGLPRAKRWLYDSGTRIPLIVHIPEDLRSETTPAHGQATDRLVSSIDLGPTVLNLAGLETPDWMQGRAFLGSNAPDPRDYVFGARDRMDERYDIIRMVRDKRFKYLRNYEPKKTYYQYMNTPEKGATMSELRRLHEQGELPAAAEAYFAPTKPTEELYDTANDPHEIHNLAADPAYADVLERMRDEHLRWVRATKDLGLIAEPLLVEYEQQLGNRYAILRQADGDALSERIARTAVWAGGDDTEEPLRQALADPAAAVRYWAATGLGNLPQLEKHSLQELQRRLTDDAAVVRVAAARALCRAAQTDPAQTDPAQTDPAQTDQALQVLADTLRSGAQWERLHAAIVLDEIDEQARPLLDAMHEALEPRKSLYANGKYTVRVINRALNQLEGTSRSVP